jgi:hypothetical protein
MDRYDAYTIASKQFTIMQTSLHNKYDAASLIDETLVACITRVSITLGRLLSLIGRLSRRGPYI